MPDVLRQPTHVREIGPLLVTWYEDGSVWARGLPPLHRLERLDTRSGELQLDGFARACARIDQCTAQSALDRLGRELAHAHDGDPFAPYLAQWVQHRSRVLAHARHR